MVERLTRQAESERERAAAAQQRAHAAESMQARFTAELERERQRAQGLEESYGGLQRVVDQLTEQAQEAATAKGENGASALASRIRELAEEAEAANRRAQERDAECWEVKNTLAAVRVELDGQKLEWEAQQEAYESQIADLVEECRELQKQLPGPASFLCPSPLASASAAASPAGGEAACAAASAAPAAAATAEASIVVAPAIQAARATSSMAGRGLHLGGGASKAASKVSMARWMQTADAARGGLHANGFSQSHSLDFSLSGAYEGNSRHSLRN